MTTYTLSTPSGKITRDGTINVPSDDTDPEYQLYQAWLAAGNGPDIVQDPPPPPPSGVSALQIMNAMSQMGLETATAEQLAGDVYTLALTL